MIEPEYWYTEKDGCQVWLCGDALGLYSSGGQPKRFTITAKGDGYTCDCPKYKKDLRCEHGEAVLRVMAQTKADGAKAVQAKAGPSRPNVFRRVLRDSAPALWLISDPRSTALDGCYTVEVEGIGYRCNCPEFGQGQGCRHGEAVMIASGAVEMVYRYEMDAWWNEALAKVKLD